MNMNRLTENMEHISRADLAEHLDEYLERADKENIGFVITDEGKNDLILCPASWFGIVADSDLECIIGCALRYAIGRNTYMPGLVCDFIKKHIDVLSENAVEVMINDIDRELENNIEQADVWQSLRSDLAQKQKDYIDMNKGKDNVLCKPEQSQ